MAHRNLAVDIRVRPVRAVKIVQRGLKTVHRKFHVGVCLVTNKVCFPRVRSFRDGLLPPCFEPGHDLHTLLQYRVVRASDPFRVVKQVVEAFALANVLLGHRSPLIVLSKARPLCVSFCSHLRETLAGCASGVLRWWRRPALGLPWTAPTRAQPPRKAPRWRGRRAFSTMRLDTRDPESSASPERQPRSAHDGRLTH